MKNLINRVLPLIFAAIMLATPAVAESDWKSNLLDEFVSLIRSMEKAYGVGERDQGGQAASLRGGLNGTVGGLCVGSGVSPLPPLPEATVQKALRLYEGLLRGGDINMDAMREVMKLCLTHIEDAMLASGVDKQRTRFLLEGTIRQMLLQFKEQLNK